LLEVGLYKKLFRDFAGFPAGLIIVFIILLSETEVYATDRNDHRPPIHGPMEQPLRL